jgi:hypothetical protein
MDCEHTLATVSDDELLRRLIELLKHTRRAEADLVAHIGEVDARRLFAREAFPSMFAYCIDVLHLSEAEAYLRITAARAAREHPLLLDMLADGRLHLSGIGKLAPHLTPANRDSLLQRATGKTKRQIEELTAEIAPRPDVPPVMRKLPARTPGRGPEVGRENREEPRSATLPGPARSSTPLDAVASSVTSGPPSVVVALAHPDTSAVTGTSGDAGAPSVIGSSTTIGCPTAWAEIEA